MTPVVLTIGALDPLGADGIIADLRSFAALGVHGAAAISLVEGQALPRESADILDQIHAVRAELPIAAVKIGALGSAKTAHAVVEALAGLQAPLVADPSLAAPSRHRLKPAGNRDSDLKDTRANSEAGAASETAAQGADAGLLAAWREAVLPAAAIATPNLAEAALLTGTKRAATRADMLAQAEALCRLGSAHAIVSGGHGAAETSTDILASADGVSFEMRAERLERGQMRGLSATFAAAIAAYLAHGNAPLQAAQMAKLFTSNAIAMAEHPGGSATIRSPHPLARLWQMAAEGARPE